MADDPFDSVVKQCRVTSSQEDVLRTCPFARQSEVFNDDESSPTETSDNPVDPTGIIMISLPDSTKDESPQKEEFQTPPQEPLLASSEEQRDAAAVDAPADQEPGSVSDGGKTLDVDGLCAEAGRAVDLGNDSDNLGFSGVKLTQVPEGGDGVDGSCGVHRSRVNEIPGCELENFEVLQRESNDAVPVESPSKKLKMSEVNSSFESQNVCIGNIEHMSNDTNQNWNASTEVLEQSVGEGGALGLDGDPINLDSLQKQTEEDPRVSKSDEMRENYEVGSSGKNIEDIDKFKYVAPSSINECGETGKGGWGKRELPYSIVGQEMNAAEESVSGSLLAKNQLLKDILAALKMVAGKLDDGSEDVDFLETAKRRGMTFPTPKWWPPEGFA